ncbi:MAG TPA: alpha/beta hydrolase [Limnochordia bacterium]|nr:alpha/beta hydrolase [Limnochordia bacterium]
MSNFTIRPHVRYGMAGGHELRLDLYLPDERAQHRPLLMIIHGGAWYLGDKRDYGLNAVYAERAAAAGMPAVSVNYRYSSMAPFPAQLDDLRAALGWIGANAERLGIDAGRIALLGASAGGHLASLLALTVGRSAGSEGAPTIRAVVSFCGPQDLTGIAYGTRAEAADSVRRLIGGPPETHAEAYRQASPLFHVHPGAPAFLFIHGELDPGVPIDQAERMHAALAAQRVPSRLIRVRNGAHDPTTSANEEPVSPGLAEIDREIDAFLQERLGHGIRLGAIV